MNCRWVTDTETAQAVTEHNTTWKHTNGHRGRDNSLPWFLISPILASSPTESKWEETRPLSSCLCKLWIRRDYCCQSMPPPDLHAHCCHSPNLPLTICALMCQSECACLSFALPVHIYLSLRERESVYSLKNCYGAVLETAASLNEGKLREHVIKGCSAPHVSANRTYGMNRIKRNTIAIGAGILNEGCGQKVQS